MFNGHSLSAVQKPKHCPTCSFLHTLGFAHAAAAAVLALEFSSEGGGRGLIMQLLVDEQVVGLGEVPLALVALKKRLCAG